VRYQAALHPAVWASYAFVYGTVNARAICNFQRNSLAPSIYFWYQIDCIFFLAPRLGDFDLELLHKTFPPYAPKKGEEYMNSRQREHFKKVLGALKVELSQDIDRTVQAMQDDATLFADPNDRASQESDIALELRNRDRERKLIKKIEETIARIEKDEYGYCENCGVEIGLKRLEARPTATLCIDCKTLDELKEKQVAK
jgi:DnaK suppressor protein